MTTSLSGLEQSLILGRLVLNIYFHLFVHCGQLKYLVFILGMVQKGSVVVVIIMN